jgi:ABC-type uncharacterized transport system permease subunit
VIRAVLAAAALQATPLLLAAMGGLVNRLGGIVNIGLEGMMLVGALVAVVVSAATGSWLAGVAAAGAAGLVTGVLLSLPITRLGANEIIAGLGLNILVAGVVGYVLKSVLGTSGTLRPDGLVTLPRIELPGLAAVPVLGDVLSGKDPVTWAAWALVPVLAVLLARTRWGLRLRATGAGEEVARSLGLPVARIRDASSAVAGALAGVAGAHLSLGLVGLFNLNMVAGRGFIALAAFYFGRARPWPTAAGALLFALFDAAQIRMQRQGVPAELVQMLPYLVVVAVLTAAALRSWPRAARGRARTRTREVTT